MQRTEHGYVIIACDYCRTDWDQVKPMIEGHRGSVLCLHCLKTALADLHPRPGDFFCNLCVRSALPADLPRWTSPATDAHLCRDCAHQAARAFSKDKEVDWTWDANPKSEIRNSKED
jgi:hypothetical protein